MRLLSKSAVVLALLMTYACIRGPVIDTGSKPPGVGGTIAGIVRTSGSNAPLSGRKVTAIELGSGARYEASTATNGGYTMKVPTGKYRLEVELRDGETLAEHPAETEINTSDLDASRNFVIAVKAPN